MLQLLLELCKWINNQGGYVNISFSLYRLQSLDSQIKKLKSRISEIETIINQDIKIKKAYQATLDAEEKLNSQRKNMKLILEQIENKQIKLKLTQNSLFAGKIKNPKELQDLQMEEQALNRTIRKLEDEQLDYMILLEEAEGNLKRSMDIYNEILGNQISEHANLNGERVKLETEIASLKNQRDPLEKTIPDDVLATYQTLIETKGGFAVSAVIDDCCDACGAPLTPGDLQAARSPSTVFRCRTCNRFLYKS